MDRWEFPTSARHHNGMKIENISNITHHHGSVKTTRRTLNSSIVRSSPFFLQHIPWWRLQLTSGSCLSQLDVCGRNTPLALSRGALLEDGLRAHKPEDTIDKYTHTHIHKYTHMTTATKLVNSVCESLRYIHRESAWMTICPSRNHNHLSGVHHLPSRIEYYSTDRPTERVDDAARIWSRKGWHLTKKGLDRFSQQANKVKSWGGLFVLWK